MAKTFLMEVFRKQSCDLSIIYVKCTYCFMYLDESEDKIAMLTSKNGHGWSVVEFEKVKEIPEACLLQLPTGGKTFR